MAFEGIKLDRGRGIGDTNNPLPKFEKPENDRSPNEASAPKYNAGSGLEVQLRQAIVDLHFFEKVGENKKLEKSEKRGRGYNAGPGFGW